VVENVHGGVDVIAIAALGVDQASGADAVDD